MTVYGYIRTSRASMGPPPFDGGNHVPDYKTIMYRSASMGPPPFDGGNFHPAIRAGPLQAKLQWGHRLSTVETPPAAAGTWASLLLQWGHRLSTVETAGQHLLDKSSQHASMGPPPFDGGNAGAHPLLPLTSERFNGATAFRRWKLRERAGWGRGSAKLQWGHRLSTVETSCARLYTVLPVPASMGPPPFDGGNIVIDVGVVNDPVASMGPPPFDGGNL